MNKIDSYMPLNENFILYVVVGYPCIPSNVSNAIVKNASYLFLYFYLPLLDSYDCWPIEFDLN